VTTVAEPIPTRCSCADGEAVADEGFDCADSLELELAVRPVLDGGEVWAEGSAPPPSAALDGAAFAPEQPDTREIKTAPARATGKMATEQRDKSRILVMVTFFEIPSAEDDLVLEHAYDQ
jgi:hypothetical protein